MTLRAWLTSLLGLLAIILLALPMRATHAGTRPELRVYACEDDGSGQCRRSTPPFDSCGGWAGWKIPFLDPNGGPFTAQESDFSGQAGERTLQCAIFGGNGGLAIRSINKGQCQTTTDTSSGPDAFNRLCTGTDSMPPKQMGCSKTAVGNPVVGNPVNCAPSVGNKYEVALDYVGTGPFPLRLERYYNSGGTRFFPGSSNQAFAMSNWRHSYERGISFMVRQGISFARVDRQDGKSIYFTLVGGTWTPGEPDITERLEQAVENAQTVWKFTNVDDEVERYDVQTGRLLSITNRAGLTQSVLYDTHNRVASVTDPFGRALTFSYGAANCSGDRCVASVQDPSGNLIQYGYDTLSLFGGSFTRLRTVTYPGTATPRTYNYDDANNPVVLIEIIDENGTSYANWTYDGSARGTLSQHAGGAEKVTMQYLDDNSVQITATISAGATPVNRVNTYQYQTIQGVQRLTAITGDACPSCGPKTIQYDPNGLGFVFQTTDWNNNVTKYFREDPNHVDLETSRTEALGTPQERTITTAWHQTFRLPILITEPGRTTAMAYDATTGNLLTRTMTDTASTKSRTWTYTYYPNNRQVFTIDGPRTNVTDVTTYTYYANDDPDLGKRGNIATITNALNHITQITAYNAHGQPTTIIDPNGLTTTLEYDLRQRLKSRKVGDEITTYDYDFVGQLIKVTMPDGSFLNYTYDAAHRLTEIDDSLPNPNRIVYTLDAMGNRTLEQVFASTGALVQTHSRFYNTSNRLEQDIAALNPSTGVTPITRYTYFDQGNLNTITDPLNLVTTNDYDALNRLKSVTDPNMGLVKYEYNALDQMFRVTDPRNVITTYTYDALNNLTQLQSPDTGTTQYPDYDEAGNLKTQIDAKGQTTTYTYDALNRAASISYTTDPSLNVIFTYDQGTNGIGRLTGVTDSTGTISYAYDPKGRLTSETRVINGITYVTGYSYDTAGRLTGITYPSGRQVTYTLDALGRIYAITTTKDGTPQTVLSNADYHPFGPLRAFTFGNGQNYIRGIDQNGRIYGYTLGSQAFELRFDDGSRVRSITDHADSTNTNAYDYDTLDRLTQATLPSTVFLYSYDAGGNRLSRTVGTARETYIYGLPPNPDNRLSTLTSATGQVRNFVYDDNGSTKDDAVKQFTYDARGRLIQTNSSLGAVQYGVNSLGQRIRKTSTLGDTVYHYDSGGRLIAETSAGGTVRTEYIYLNDIPVAVIK